MRACLFAAALLVGLASCHKGDAPPASTIVGTWKYTTETTVATPLSGGASTTATRTYPSGGLLLTFDPQGLGTAYYSAGGYPSAKVKYSYQSDDLIINDPAYPQVYKVLSLTDKELVIKSSSSDGMFSYVVTDNLTRVL